MYESQENCTEGMLALVAHKRLLNIRNNALRKFSDNWQNVIDIHTIHTIDYILLRRFAAIGGGGGGVDLFSLPVGCLSCLYR